MASPTLHCNAVVARALVDPDFLGRLAEAPDLALDEMQVPHELRVTLGQLDTDRLVLMAGYLCMVKHNHLWWELPVTRQLLHDEGLELAVFTAYARSRRRTTRRGRPVVGDFVDFLTSHLAEPGWGGGLLADVARHELVLAHLASPQVTDELRRSSVPQGHGPSDRGEWRPRCLGLVVVQAYHHDPAELPTLGSRGIGRLRNPVGSEQTFVCYSRRRPDDGVRFFCVDPATALVLGAIDGVRAVGDLAAAAGLPVGSESLVESVLAGAVENELVVPHNAEPGPVVDMLAGYFAARTFHVLHRAGVLDELRAPRSAGSVAEALGLEADWLWGCLAYLARVSDVVERLDDGRFRANVPTYEQFGFALDKFVGAYGPCLDEAGPCPSRVDGKALAEAFERVANERERHGGDLPIATLLAEWEATDCVVDLGCGPASLLVGMASRHPAFTGIGVDANPAMCAAAEEAIVRRGVEGQVTILEGDALAVLATLPEGTRRQVTAIYGRSFFNACFGRGPAQAVDAVRRLAGLFPGRLVVVDDYYGELERCPTGRSPDHRAACLQDLVQVWSGQGVPPGDRDGWAAVYAAGNARLRRSYEGDADGFRRFVHVVELDGAGSR